jgi:hypothetical protein
MLVARSGSRWRPITLRRAQKEHGSINVQEGKTVVESLPSFEIKNKISGRIVLAPSFANSSRTFVPLRSSPDWRLPMPSTENLTLTTKRSP